MKKAAAAAGLPTLCADHALGAKSCIQETIVLSLYQTRRRQQKAFELDQKDKDDFSKLFSTHDYQQS